MRTEVKEYLKDYLFRDVLVILGMILMIAGDVDDPKLALFICGGFIALCGTNLILSQRISDLHERIKDLERKKIDALEWDSVDEIGKND